MQLMVRVGMASIDTTLSELITATAPDRVTHAEVPFRTVR
jgi:hypothetical protein